MYQRDVKAQVEARQRANENFQKWCKEKSKWPCRMVKKNVL